METTITNFKDEYRESNNAKLSLLTLVFLIVMILCIITVVAVVIVAILIPSNASIITVLIGITTPIILALLGAAIEGMHRAVNSRLSSLLRLTETSAYARGKLEGAKPNGIRIENNTVT